MNRFIIIFAGPVGSSKSPIASYLSYSFNLPIFRTDDIRSEVSEDLLHFDDNEFQNRRKERLMEVIKKGNSFILDASVDREWKNYKDLISKEGYKTFVISIDLTKKFITKLLEVKGYKETLKRVDKLMEDHNNFLSEFGEVVNFRITDDNFIGRLEESKKAFGIWLSNLL